MVFSPCWTAWVGPVEEGDGEAEEDGKEEDGEEEVVLSAFRYDGK